MKESLTEKQKQILEFISSEIKQKGYPPTVREICAGVQIKSTASVYSQLNKLQDKGIIRKDHARSRSIEIIDKNYLPNDTAASVQIPVVGNVAAGSPILAAENITEYFPLPADLLPQEHVFMLSVKGNSMIKAGIFDGDKVIVKEKNCAENGDMIVALIDDSATVKRFYKESDHIRLQPENDEYDPILVYGDLQILGQVIGVIRIF